MSIGRRVKYLWFVIVMKATWVLPDWVPIMWFRGLLIRPCFRMCGRNFQIASTAVVINSANVEIGDNVYLAHGCWVQGIGGVRLDDDVMLGPYTVVASSNHTMRNGSYRYGHPLKERVTIGCGSWTGAGTKILPGVVLGRGVLCAAGSVVTGRFSDYTIIGGVPAKELAHVDPVTGRKVKRFSAGAEVPVKTI